MSLCNNECTYRLKLQFLTFSTSFNDTHREKAPSNETRALTKSMDMDIWVVATSSHFFVRSLQLKRNFQKNKLVTGKTPFL